VRQARAGAIDPATVATDLCQYCGVSLDESPPREELGWLYGVECSRCPPERRTSVVLARPRRVEVLACPGCGADLSPPEDHPDVLTVKEMAYEVCAACGERCGVARVRRVKDLSDGSM
jgi:hypothetical protein